MKKTEQKAVTSATEKPDKLGLCSKKTEKLKNIQQTAASEHPNQATK